MSSLIPPTRFNFCTTTTEATDSSNARPRSAHSDVLRRSLEGPLQPRSQSVPPPAGRSGVPPSPAGSARTPSPSPTVAPAALSAAVAAGPSETASLGVESAHASQEAAASDPIAQTVERLHVAIDAAQAHPARPRVVSTLRSVFNSLDFVRALTTADDDKIRGDARVADALCAAREIVDHMRQVVQRYKATLPPTVARDLEQQIRHTDKMLSTFATDSHPAWRAGVLTAVRAVNTFVFLGVPAAENQKKTTALYAASSTKSALRATGLGLRKTTHGPQVMDHFIGRDLINTQQSVLFGIGLLAKVMKDRTQAEKLEHAIKSTPYMVIVGVASVIAAAVAFHHRELSHGLNRLLYGHARPGTQGEETFGDVAVRRLKALAHTLVGRSDEATPAHPWQRQRAPMDAIPESTRQALEHLLDLSHAASEGIGHLRGEVKHLGQLSDSSDKTLGKVEGAFDDIYKSMALVLGLPEPEKRPNSELLGKAFLAALALAACAAPVYFLKDNFIGLVDLCANAAFVFGIMAMHAGNRNTSLKVSEDDFGQFCGLSLVMPLVWGVNLAMGDPMERSWSSAMIGGAALTVLGNALSAPAGQWAAAGAGKVASMLNGEAPQQQVDLELGVPAPGTEPRIRPLPDDFREAAAP